MRKTAKIIIYLTILMLFSQPFFATLPSVGDGEVSHLASPDPSGVGASVKSEEENIDSFDVNPKSGRWNVTSDNSTDDLVTDSILRMTTINNLTSNDITSAVGYEMNRGTTKTDGKVEYRMAASGGGNQTEYFRDVVGDQADFEEGDEEGSTGSNMNNVAVSDGVYSGNPIAAGSIDIIRFGAVSINPTLYPFARLKFKYNVPDLEIGQTYAINLRVTNNLGALKDVLFISAFTPNNEWDDQTIELIDDDWDEGGFITALRLRSSSPGAPDHHITDLISIDLFQVIGDLDYATYIENGPEDTWDWEVENNTESWTGLVNMNVSEGFLRGTMAAGIADIFISPAGLSIDTSLFEIVKVRMNTSDVTMDFIIEADLGAGNVIVSSSIDLDSTSQTVYEIDLSDDSNWSGTCNQMQIRFDELDDTLDGDEIVFIDYLLLLGHWDDSDSVIGLFDQDNLVPLLNVSTIFTSNNSHSSTSDKAYFTVELLDLDGEVAYSAISANYTDISDLWTQTKITFDVLRSKLIVTINADNTTRIDKWTFPADFTEESGRIPALFSHEKSPYVFVSTFSVATSWQEIRLDYIKADYTERKWVQTTTPTDTDWLADGLTFAYVQNDTNDDSEYEINVPYFDSMSGMMSINFTNHDALGVGEEGSMQIFLYAVDSDDGEAHELFELLLNLGDAPFGHFLLARIQVGGVTTYQLQPIGHFSPRMSFSIAMLDERTRGEIKARIWKNTSIEESFADVVSNVTVSDEADIPSHEFIIKIRYSVNFVANVEFTAVMEDFGFVERDIFTDFINAIVEPLGNFFQQIFVGLFRFIADIFKAVGDVIGIAVLVMQGVLTAAILTMQNAITAAIGTINTAINQIQGWLTTLGTTIGTAINQIEGWLTTIAATIASAVDQIEGWLNTIASTISNAIADIAADIWTAFGTVAADIMDDIVTALTALAVDFADFVNGVIQALIPLLTALAEDFAGLLEDIIAFLLPLLGALAEGIIGFLADIVFFFWDALGLPDVLAILDVGLTGLIQFITGIPQFILDWTGFFTVIADLLVVLGFIWIFILPVIIASTAGECIGKIVDNAIVDVTGGTSILGFQVPIPLCIPWGLITIFTMLDGTIFFGFF